MEISFGFVSGSAISGWAERLATLMQPALRLSYGGVLRHCVPAGGAVLCASIALALLPLVWLGGVHRGLPLLFAVLSALCLVLERAGLQQIRAAWGVIAFTVFGLTPDLAPAFLVLLAGLVLVAQIADADLVAGVPSAWLAPVLAGSSTLLVLMFRMEAGAVGLAAAGGVLAIHAAHRFPPRVTFGTGGAVVLAFLNLWLAWTLWINGAWFAVGMLWSLSLADAVHRAFSRRHTDGRAFEKARANGEPESGLALAAGSLSIANVLLAWTFNGEPLWMQAAAMSLSLFLAFHFRRFLARGPARQRA